MIVAWHTGGMLAPRAVLRRPAQGFVTWPDGTVGPAWILETGTLLDVAQVLAHPAGFTAVAHPVDAPEVSVRVAVADLEPHGERIPF